MKRLEGKVSYLEDNLITANIRLDGFAEELKLLLAEINIISNWISQRFGVELINKSSSLFRHIHNCEDIENIVYDISTLHSSGKITGELDSEISKVLCNAERERKNVETFMVFKADNFTDETRRPGRHNIPVKLKNTKPENGKSQLERKGSDVKSVTSERVPPKRGRPKKKVSETENLKTESQCDQCGKILKDPSSLRQHKSIHKNLRPHVCPDCGKCFRRKFHLKTHSLIHAGVKKHQCGYCGKLFLLPKDLIAHERIHTGERPFSCEVCLKTFNLKAHLTMHERIHTGEKPYKCNICEKCFSQSNSLRVHKKTHIEGQKKGGLTLVSLQSLNHQHQSTEVQQNMHQVELKFQSSQGSNNDSDLGNSIVLPHVICANDSDNTTSSSQSPHVPLPVGQIMSVDFRGTQSLIALVETPTSISVESQIQNQRSTVDLQSIMLPTTSPTISLSLEEHSESDQFQSTTTSSLVLSQDLTQSQDSVFLTTRQPFFGHSSTTFSLQPFSDSKRYF